MEVSDNIVACHSCHQRAGFQRGAGDMWQDHYIFHR